MRRAVLIYNPMSGRHQGPAWVPRLVQCLEAGGFEVQPQPTAMRGDATALARRAVAQGVEVAFALGGDGTLREVAAGLLGSPVALGPLPAGTTNVLARALGIPLRPMVAAEFLCRQSVQTMDVGLVGQEPFLMLASCGLDADIMSRQNSDLKRRFGKLAILALGLRRWWSYDYATHHLQIDGVETTSEFFALANIPLYAGNFRLAPDANPHDGELNLVLFKGHGRWATLSLGWDLLLGRHRRRRDVEMRVVRELVLEGPASIPVQLDGDIVYVEPPVRLGIAKQQLSVLAPAISQTGAQSTHAQEVPA